MVPDSSGRRETRTDPGISENLGPPFRTDSLVERLDDALGYARRREYTGWDYWDGLSTPFREVLPFESRVVNLTFQETIKRSPVNVRPLFLVERRRNSMGTALFAMANLNAHRLRAAGEGRDEMDDVDYADEAVALTEWLCENRRSGYSGFCVGHNHEIQRLDSKELPEDPDVVGTSFATRALLRVGEHVADRNLVETARSAADYVLEDMNYREGSDGATVDYHVHDHGDVYIPNSSALSARLFLDLYGAFGTEEFRRCGERLLDRVVTCQTDDGGWRYSYPADASNLSMDSLHNGFILECLERHRAVVATDRYADAISTGLSFYRTVMFDSDGAPNWDESSSYPRDVHAAANGILVFTYAGEYDVAERILGWTLEHLYDEDDGRFYYRKGRLHTRRVTLMRWCQAWMCYAISEYLARVRLGTALHDVASHDHVRPE